MKFTNLFLVLSFAFNLTVLATDIKLTETSNQLSITEKTLTEFTFVNHLADIKTMHVKTNTGEPKILLKKINSILKRLRLSNTENHVIDLGEIIINRNTYSVTHNEKVLTLPRKEFELFYLLASKPGNVFTRDEIMGKVWGSEIIVGDRTIDVHIRKLREKIGDSYFKTIKGVGYKFTQ